MEEELNYVAVTFKTTSTHETSNDMETIYDEVKTGEPTWATNPVLPENQKKADAPLLRVVAAVLGIICIILVSLVIALSIHLHTIMSEQRREHTALTAQILQLQEEQEDLERQKEELSREKDGLNWTIGVILEYKNFPVETHCPQKVCKPCLDGWLLFQSKCYWFSTSDYYSQWRSWKGSRDKCRETRADLVVVNSHEEQEFINNHTTEYRDEKHGYWVGLSSDDETQPWMWVDGSNVTVMYWRTEDAGYRSSCALTLPHDDPLANWDKAGCDMRNRWICETEALIKEPAASYKPNSSVHSVF